MVWAVLHTKRVSVIRRPNEARAAASALYTLQSHLRVILAAIYDKAEQSTISNAEIQKIITEEEA